MSDLCAEHSALSETSELFFKSIDPLLHPHGNTWVQPLSVLLGLLEFLV
jgi:hypothetical protein